jgi:two-component system phosphate regulon response regulator PhoB
MAQERILVVEDEEDIQELVRYNLEKESFRVTCATTGEEALEAVTQKVPDLILLDLMLPGIDGLSVCRELRASDRTGAVPIVMVTAKDDEADVVTGLELGADDYVTKPFSPRVLLARVRAVLRRTSSGPETADVIHRGPITIDTARHSVSVDGEALDLTLTEFRVLEFLARRPGMVFTRYQIVDAVKGEDYPVTDRSVDVQIVGLRKKLGDVRDCIETVRGVGYRFRMPDNGEARDA